MSDGQHLGTLCVFDMTKKELSAHQQMMLSILSKQVVYILELEMTAKLLQQQLDEIPLQKEKNAQSKIKLRSFFESASSCYFLLGREGEIMYYNKAARDFIDLQKSKCMIMSGEKLSTFLTESFEPLFAADYDRSLAGMFLKADHHLLHNDGTKHWWQLEYAPAYNADNEIIGVSFNAVNVNDRRIHLTN